VAHCEVSGIAHEIDDVKLTLESNHLSDSWAQRVDEEVPDPGSRPAAGPTYPEHHHHSP
jgi:hypothetical protein